MKKTITLLFVILMNLTKAQSVATFENFSLPVDSFYYSSSSADFQTSNAVFEYEWATSTFGGYWSKGFSYTNKTDSSNGGYQNLYNCIAYKGYNNSNYYATAQTNGIIKLKTSTDNVVDGFYINNTTYAYKSMKSGDMFAKKFGGASGNDPDWFKVTVKGYYNGTMKTDSAEFYLADYRFSNNALDYIVKGWQWVNCSNLGVVDSIQFFMYSSDNGSFGMNTPAFFSMDNFTTSKTVGINEMSLIQNVKLFPNPANETIYLEFNASQFTDCTINIYGATGNLIKSKNIEINTGNQVLPIDISELNSGFYFIEMIESATQHNFKIIKN